MASYILLHCVMGQNFWHEVPDASLMLSNQVVTVVTCMWALQFLLLKHEGLFFTGSGIVLSRKELQSPCTSHNRYKLVAQHQ